jgi:hypothetical protein
VAGPSAMNEMPSLAKLAKASSGTIISPLAQLLKE